MPSRARRQQKKNREQSNKSKKTSNTWSIPDFNIPATREELEELAKIGKVPPVNELEQQAFASGNQITQIQFAALRIISRMSEPARS
ncbi:hypothetical protein IFM47457_03561 [Aspergillus lentulus]|nr:hypothetical protein IFM47457_03561 [Aspergillus lentulus]